MQLCANMLAAEADCATSGYKRDVLCRKHLSCRVLSKVVMIERYTEVDEGSCNCVVRLTVNF